MVTAVGHVFVSLKANIERFQPSSLEILTNATQRGSVFCRSCVGISCL